MPDTSKEIKKEETSSKPLTDEEERRKEVPDFTEKSEKRGNLPESEE